MSDEITIEDIKAAQELLDREVPKYTHFYVSESALVSFMWDAGFTEEEIKQKLEEMGDAREES